jgi:PAS domain S-box-containing protein
MPTSPESVSLFNVLPTPHLLLSPAFVIEAVSDSYLHATLTRREHLVGQYMFDVFPDNPQTPEANGTRNVRASMQQVLATRQPQQIAQQHYDVPDPERPGQFVERYWQALNAPVLDAQGNVTHIIHSALDITAEVQGQAQLHKSQAMEQVAREDAEAQRQRFYDLLMQMPAAVVTYRGPTHIYDLVNPLYQQLFRNRRLQGLPIREALPELLGQDIIEKLDHVYASGEAYYAMEQETWVDVTDTGRPERRYYNVLFQPLHDAHGRVDGLLNFAYDVTEQVQSREQLQQLNTDLEARVAERTKEALALQADLLAAAQRQAQAREELYQVFEQAPVMVALLRGPNHLLHYRNPAFQELFLDRALTDRPYGEALPEIVAAGLLPELDRVYATGQPYYGTAHPLVTTPSDGSAPRLRYHDFSYQPYYEAHHLVGISVFAYDVTEQVLARQEREAQQQLVRIVFDQAPAGIWVVQGPDYVFEVVNPLMTQILGRSQEQLLGYPYFEVLPELRSQGLPELLRQVWEQGEAVFVAELAAQLPYHAPDEVGYFTFIFQPLRDEHGQVNRISCVALDVTTQVQARQQVQGLNEELAVLNEELRATNEELNESNRQLTRTNVDLDTFVYTASHDLKAPITNIESIALALRDTLADDVQQNTLVAQLLDLLDTTVTRFRFTIGQLTDISRLQLAHAGPAEPVVLAAVVQDVRLDLMPAIAAAGARLTVAVPAELVVSFSPANLRSIVYNLLSNALKYRALDRPSRVHVQATYTGQSVALAVHDNGLGMSEMQQRQLFGLFQRLHTHVEGTGVGLYITKRLVENAGGTIAVQSQPGVGTTFTVTFPA